MLLFLSVLTLYHFLSAMFDGPGYVEVGWQPQKPEDEDYLQFCEVRFSCCSRRFHTMQHADRILDTNGSTRG